MGLLSFLKGAGQKVFGNSEASNTEKAEEIKNHLSKYELPTEGIEILVDGEKVTLSGTLGSHDVKQKIVVAAGNVEGVSEIEDNLTINSLDFGTEEVALPVYYTVVSGDSLSKIAKEQYGDANKYPQIFEANKPMLSHPDKIYPGQVLVIPQN